jgi:hypothetical protein
MRCFFPLVAFLAVASATTDSAVTVRHNKRRRLMMNSRRDSQKEHGLLGQIDQLKAELGQSQGERAQLGEQLRQDRLEDETLSVQLKQARDNYAALSNQLADEQGVAARSAQHERQMTEMTEMTDRVIGALATEIIQLKIGVAACFIVLVLASFWFASRVLKEKVVREPKLRAANDQVCRKSDSPSAEHPRADEESPPVPLSPALPPFQWSQEGQHLKEAATFFCTQALSHNDVDVRPQPALEAVHPVSESVEAEEMTQKNDCGRERAEAEETVGQAVAALGLLPSAPHGIVDDDDEEVMLGEEATEDAAEEVAADEDIDEAQVVVEKQNDEEVADVVHETANTNVSLLPDTEDQVSASALSAVAEPKNQEVLRTLDALRHPHREAFAEMPVDAELRAKLDKRFIITENLKESLQ